MDKKSNQVTIWLSNEEKQYIDECCAKYNLTTKQLFVLALLSLSEDVVQTKINAVSDSKGE